MSIPKYDQMYRSFLKSLEDGKVHPYIDAKRQVIKDFKLSEEDVSEMLENGKQTLFNNRIGWCRTYLKKATLIEEGVGSRRKYYERNPKEISIFCGVSKWRIQL